MPSIELYFQSNCRIPTEKKKLIKIKNICLSFIPVYRLWFEAAYTYVARNTHQQLLAILLNFKGTVSQEFVPPLFHQEHVYCMFLIIVWDLLCSELSRYRSKSWSLDSCFQKLTCSRSWCKDSSARN